MHGLMECIGNVQELCAVKYLSQEEWWRFLQCVNSYGRGEIGTPKTAKRCAVGVGFDWNASGVGACADVLPGDGDESPGGGDKGEVEGVGLLKESVRRSQELGIQ
jgi:hypothetical protein